MQPHELAKIFSELEELKNTLKLSLKNLQPTQPLQSEDVKEVYTALAKAQGDYGVVKKSRQAHYAGGYADLDDIMTAVRPALEKNGLAFYQNTDELHDGTVMLYSIIAHSSGQWISSRIRVKAQDQKITSFGSALTYSRRYMVTALLGITIPYDPLDDDGADPDDNIPMNGNSYTQQPRDSFERISKDELAELEYALRLYPDIAEQLKESLKLRALSEMPKSRYRSSIEKVRSIIEARKTGAK